MPPAPPTHSLYQVQFLPDLKYGDWSDSEWRGKTSIHEPPTLSPSESIGTSQCLTTPVVLWESMEKLLFLNLGQVEAITPYHN